MHCHSRPQDASGATPPALTPRERELLGYITQGQSNKVIAIDFGISTRTAEAHRARIFRKMGVRSALELACALCPYRGPGGPGGPGGAAAPGRAGPVIGRPGPAA
ncbi:response regulator transcription factor [Bordetella genomosp. 13]|uniref:response regulator transcription factor n=1 Tax=Bordetella genomosp. 13 TaxID=463040 RepID=UPI0011A7B674|nr:helix-turn-helix transcriptional regulator [Bordetella genomosp. 13]